MMHSMNLFSRRMHSFLVQYTYNTLLVLFFWYLLFLRNMPILGCVQHSVSNQNPFEVNHDPVVDLKGHHS